MKKLLFFLLAGVLFTACAPQAAAPVVKPTMPLPTRTSTPAPAGLWISPAVPDALRQTALSWNVPIIVDSSPASMRLDVERAPSSIVNRPSSIWIYVLAAPFPTVTDGVTLDEFRAAWNGASSATFNGRPLWMAESTLSAFAALWGAPADGSVKTASADQLLDLAWKNYPSWAIIPFEAIEPKWKVLSVDGQSPIRKDFDATKYPLQITFALQTSQPSNLQTFDLPQSNRDPSKLATVVVTGVTALVRMTAIRMEQKGVNYPGEKIRDWLLNADIAHISNEIPFADGCPPPNPYSARLIFCSDPRYLDLLKYIGTDVVELTGNHLMDWGAPATLMTVDMYNQSNIPHFGGGSDLEDSKKPALFTINGNKIAFIGCKPADNDGYVATDVSPGAAPCGDWEPNQIRLLKSQGYNVIATFQYWEYYSPEPRPGQAQDFRAAADAGAVIVSGSQAHAPQAMEFYQPPNGGDAAFIHYGPGNLFFDQMQYNLTDQKGKVIGVTDNTRREFLDRHVFYDNRYISTELLAAMLEDYSQPRPMTDDERADFLGYIWNYTDWGIPGLRFETTIVPVLFNKEP